MNHIIDNHRKQLAQLITQIGQDVLLELVKELDSSTSEAPKASQPKDSKPKEAKASKPKPDAKSEPKTPAKKEEPALPGEEEAGKLILDALKQLMQVESFKAHSWLAVLKFDQSGLSLALQPEGTVASVLSAFIPLFDTLPKDISRDGNSSLDVVAVALPDFVAALKKSLKSGLELFFSKDGVRLNTSFIKYQKQEAILSALATPKLPKVKDPLALPAQVLHKFGNLGLDDSRSPIAFDPSGVIFSQALGLLASYTASDRAVASAFLGDYALISPEVFDVFKANDELSFYYQEAGACFVSSNNLLLKVGWANSQKAKYPGDVIDSWVRAPKAARGVLPSAKGLIRGINSYTSDSADGVAVPLEVTGGKNSKLAVSHNENGPKYHKDRLLQLGDLMNMYKPMEDPKEPWQVYMTARKSDTTVLVLKKKMLTQETATLCLASVKD